MVGNIRRKKFPLLTGLIAELALIVGQAIGRMKLLRDEKMNKY